MKTLLFALLLLATGTVHAQLGWYDKEGRAAPDTDSRKSMDGFAGLVLVTSDVDWKKKWDTSPETTPNFTEAKKVARGKHVFVLVFFVNPQLDDGGVANVTYDLDVLEPDGTSQAHQTDLPCAKGVLQGPPHNTRLADGVADFVGDPGDPAGEWTVRVTLKDNQRHTTVALKTSLVLE